MNASGEKYGRIAGIALLSALMLLLPSFSASASVAETRQSTELTLRVAVQDDIKSLNPIVASDTHSWDVLKYIYDAAVYFNPDTVELIPYIVVGSANLSSKSGGWTWDDCGIGTFGFNRKSCWAPTSQYGEAVVFYDFENATWHDGQQMDIRDVMFSMHVWAQVPEWSSSMNPLKDMGGKTGSNYTTSAWLHVYKVWESPDKLRAALKFVLQDAYAGFFRDTLSTFLLPEHIWAYKVSGQAVDGAKIWSDPGFSLSGADSWKIAPAQYYSNNPPVGSGPFKFELRNTGQSIKLSTNREYFFCGDYKYIDYVLDNEGKSLARQPTIEAVTYKIFKTAEAAILALKNDDIDYIAWSMPPSFVQELSGTPGVGLHMSAENGFYYLAYNMRKSSFGYRNGNPANEDSGKSFRTAIAHCIDKNRIVDRLLLGMGIAGDCPVSPLSEWYNTAIPRYNFYPEEAKIILADAGYKVRLSSNGTLVSGQAAIDAAGSENWWVNPDGTNIGSMSGGKIEILTPEAYYDPIRAQAGLMIAQQLRDVGINAESVAMDFGSIVDRIDNRDFDMYILGWRIGSDPTDFLWALFHSSNAQIGQNYPGYQNASFDAIIDQARATGNLAERKQLVNQAQASLAYDLPYDVLYFRTNIEAYRSDRFTGWVAGSSGSIYNHQTLMNLRPLSQNRVVAQFNMPPSAMESAGTEPLTVLVRDRDGNPLHGARVWLRCSKGSLSAQEGLTGADGKLVIQFTAPHVAVPCPTDPYYHDILYNGTPVTISIDKAAYTSPAGVEYDLAPTTFTEIRVFPAGASFLSLRVAADPDIITDNQGGTLGFTFVYVNVFDESGSPVLGSSISLGAYPSELTVEQDEQVTDENGLASFKVTVSDLPYDDDTVTEYRISAVATHPSDANIVGRREITLHVMDKSGEPAPAYPEADAGPDQSVSPGDEVVFNGSGSVSHAGSLNYTWTFTCNDTAVTLYGVSPKYTFWKSERCKVTLTVRNANGNTDTDSMYVTVTVPEEKEGASSAHMGWLLPAAAVTIVAVAAVASFMLLRRKRGPSASMPPELQPGQQNPPTPPRGP